MTFDDIWPTLPIPGEYDIMDECDQQRWRWVLNIAYMRGYESGYAAGREEMKHTETLAGPGRESGRA